MYVTKNPKGYGKSFVQKSALRKPIHKEMIVIRTEMCMTKTHSKRNGSRSYRNVHDETHSKRNGSHSYRNVHDENQFKKKWIVIRTEMCKTKTHSKRNV